MKVLLKILIIIVILFILFTIGLTVFLRRDLELNENLVINDVDLENVLDGTYKGMYGNGRWANEVEVTIEEKEITNIKVIKAVTFERGDTTKELLDKVIEEQKVNVDTVSGATATNNCYLKSIENALK